MVQTLNMRGDRHNRGSNELKPSVDTVNVTGNKSNFRFSHFFLSYINMSSKALIEPRKLIERIMKQASTPTWMRASVILGLTLCALLLLLHHASRVSLTPLGPMATQPLSSELVLKTPTKSTLNITTSELILVGLESSETSNLRDLFSQDCRKDKINIVVRLSSKSPEITSCTGIPNIYFLDMDLFSARAALSSPLPTFNKRKFQLPPKQPEFSSSNTSMKPLLPLKRQLTLCSLDVALIPKVAVVSSPSSCQFLLLDFTKSLENNLKHLMQALEEATIPILLSEDDQILSHLPFNPLIRWSDALLVVRPHQLPEVVYNTREMSEERILELKRFGYLLWKNYFSSEQAMLDATIAFVREQVLNLEPPLHQSVRSLDLMTGDYIESSTSSSRLSWSSSEERMYRWNKAFYPWRRSPLSIQRSRRGSFDLEENIRDEKFTLVVLTYKRWEALVDLVQTLQSIKELHAIVAVWNDVEGDAKGPIDSSIPVHLVKMQSNSLNNRFLPLDAIETEAVLHLDDDTRIPLNDIRLGFRVWKENRDRMVGLAGRMVRKDQNGKYEYKWSGMKFYNLALTGAAFIHKFYHYAYTYEMKEELRAKVDELFNCEDIFLNGLVFEQTGKAPIIVGKQEKVGKTCMTNQCSGGHSISRSSDHLAKRLNCVASLEQIYGLQNIVATTYEATNPH